MSRSISQYKSPLLKKGFSLGGLFHQIIPDKILESYSVPQNDLEVKGSDSYWMLEALIESHLGVGRTNPNPSVGCILVDANGLEISRGYTQPYPGIHAERSAFSQINDPKRLRGATAYVTLEPCSHFGNQPPCVELITQSDVHRVVIARSDPNPKVNGQGIQKLRDAGKRVEVGLLGAEATAWNFGFFAHQILKRPVVILKWAQTLDGQLADDSGKSKWITGPAARAYTHWLRQKYDCILIGAKTLLSDIPRLNVRDCKLPHQSEPLPIIFDPNGISFQVDENHQRNLVSNTFSPDRFIVIVTSKQILHQNKHSWLQNRKEVTFLPLDGKNTMLELQSMLQSTLLSQVLGRPVQTIFVEGGPKTLTSFIQAEIADAFHVFTTPLLTGGRNNRIDLLRNLSDAKKFDLINSCAVGPDILLEMVQPVLSKTLFCP